MFINSGDNLGWSRATLKISFGPLNLDSGGIRQYQAVSVSIRQYQAVLGSFRQCQTV